MASSKFYPPKSFIRPTSWDFCFGTNILKLRDFFERPDFFFFLISSDVLRSGNNEPTVLF